MHTLRGYEEDPEGGGSRGISSLPADASTGFSLSRAVSLFPSYNRLLVVVMLPGEGGKGGK